MRLGEAFIEVRADTRPFTRDLDRDILRAVQRAEVAISRSIADALDSGSRGAEKAGGDTGDNFSRGLKNSLLFSDKNIFIALAGSLAAALDDGISALPTEVKAALVGGIILASPLIGAILGAAITTGVGLGLVGIGIILASQFEDVQQRASDFGSSMRNTLAFAAEAFGPAIIQALDIIESKIHSLFPVLESLFTTASGFLEPLTIGLTEGLGAIIESLEDIAPNLQPFIDTFSLGLQGTLETIAKGLKLLAETGEDGEQALRDLFFIINLLLAAFFGTITLLTRINALFHDLLNISRELSPMMDIIVGFLSKHIPHAEGELADANVQGTQSFSGLIAATKEEEKAARALIKAMERLVEATYENIQVDIDFERSLDNISEALRENGDTLDIHSEKGRRNTEEFLRGLKAAEERALNRLQVQGYTSQQAAALYDQEIAQLRNVARQAGITDAEFNELFGEIVAVSQLRLSSEEMGVDGLTDGLDEASRNALALLQLMRTLSKQTISGALLGAGVGRYADGDIVNRPTLGVFGEAGPEVIIPLTKPARAAELAQKSGLSAMLGSNGTVVMVYIGNEQLDSRMVTIVERNNQAQAKALNNGGGFI